LVQIQVTNGGKESAPAAVVAEATSPTLFEFGAGPYVTAVHLNGSLLGPTTLYPGSSTPAQPGETIVVFANGFGPTSSAVVSGSEEQGGSLQTMPTVMIGNIQATVQFAGLISPGLYQFNVVVPATAPQGDNAISATYNGVTTQPGVLINVQ
jgi:uncharacterized protein (TIGR03437 family)